MKTNNIRKLVPINYVRNLYKNLDCLESVTDFFFFFFFCVCMQKKKKKKIVIQSIHFLTFGQEIRNITFFYLGLRLCWAVIGVKALIKLDISCESSARQLIHMECQALFSFER